LQSGTEHRLLTDAITNPDKLKKLESEIHGSDVPIAHTPAVAEAISVEPEALQPEALELEALEHTEAAVETVSVSEEETAPPVEAEPVDLAPGAEELIKAPMEEKAEAEVVPTLEAAATEAGAENAGAKQESEGSDEVHPAVVKAE
jgi:hypothetical protein